MANAELPDASKIRSLLRVQERSQTPKIQLEYTDDQKQEIVRAIRAACLAQAELWDVLHEVENEHECSIELDLYLVGELAGGCNVPPSPSDLPDEEVWGSFEEHSSAILD